MCIFERLFKDQIFLKMRFYFLFFLFIITTFNAFSQQAPFAKSDSLKGMYTLERSFWDWIHADLSVSVHPDEKFISGKNIIHYRVLKPHQILHIDLQEPMYIKSVYQDDKKLKFTKKDRAHFIRLVKKQKINEINTLIIEFEGKPHEAIKAPWDGGLVWSKDENGKHFIATAVQGIGASTWWPCKDHPQDEVDSMKIHISIPTDLNLKAISNGTKIGEEQDGDNQNGWTTFSHQIQNPINSYGVTLNIGDYVTNFHQINASNGMLDLQFVSLRDHVEQASGQWKQVLEIIPAFEHYFGPYPFYQDGMKIIEVPFLGMEHQGAIAYGNEFKNGYLQRDLSGTGWGLNFDFILVHEIAHEWFGNSITASDIADMWIQESFTSYAESLFLEWNYGKEAGNEYVIGKRKNILNDRAIMGVFGVDNAGSSDMYYKGENMIHNLRHLVNNDSLWFQTLRLLYHQFDKSMVNAKQIEDFLSRETNLDLNSFFNQYVRDSRMPVLEYAWADNQLKYRWNNCIAEFDMPVPVWINSEWKTLSATTKWQSLNVEKLDSDGTISVDPSFLCTLKKLKF